MTKVQNRIQISNLNTKKITHDELFPYATGFEKLQPVITSLSYFQVFSITLTVKKYFFIKIF